MKVRIGNDVCVKVTLFNKNRRVLLSYTEASFIPSENRVDIEGDEYFDRNSKMFYLNKISSSNDITLQYSSSKAPSEFHYVEAYKTTDSESGTIDITLESDVKVGSLDEIGKCITRTDVIVWGSSDVSNDTIYIYESKSKYSSYDSEAMGIKTVRAYVVNHSLQESVKNALKNETKFIGRFPTEPFSRAYCPTAYNINSDGYHRWEVYPTNKLITPYAGFGVQPNWKHIYPDKHTNFTEYLAEVKALSTPNTYEVVFPASAQLFTGDYDIIIVAQIYQPGYSNNVKTVTIDKKNVFTLVSTSEEGVDGDVVIDVDKTDIVPYNQTDVDDIHLQSGSVVNDIAVLELNNGQKVNVPIGEIINWADV